MSTGTPIDRRSYDAEYYMAKIEPPRPTAVETTSPDQTLTDILLAVSQIKWDISRMKEDIAKIRYDVHQIKIKPTGWF